MRRERSRVIQMAAKKVGLGAGALMPIRVFKST
jgi:hypothetical protein